MYSESILEMFGISECEPTSTPGYYSELSNEQPEDALLDEKETRGILRCLVYILLKCSVMEIYKLRANWPARR